MKAIISGDFMVKLDDPKRHEMPGEFSVSFIETDKIRLYSKNLFEDGNAVFVTDCGYSNDAAPDENGCIEVYLEDYEIIFSCHDYSSSDYKSMSSNDPSGVSEIRIGICFLMRDDDSRKNHVIEQLTFKPTEITLDCSATPDEMIDAIRASSDLKEELAGCDSYDDFKSCFERYGHDICESESLWSALGLGPEADEQVARYGWGSCMVSFAIYESFEGYEG